MAEANTKKKPAATVPAVKKPAASKSGTAKSGTAHARAGKPSTAKSKTNTNNQKTRTSTATAASAKPAVKSSVKASASSAGKTKSAKKPARSTPERAKDPAQTEAKLRRRSVFVEQFLPYILVAVGLFLIACFALDALSEAAAPTDHKMGAVGYYICKGLFGCLGWAAYLIPLLMVNLVIFWKRYCKESLVSVKILLSVLVTVLIAGVSHVFLCNADPSLADVYDAGHLFRTGYEFESGGVLGGLLGYVLYLGLRLPGTVVLTVLALPLLLMCLVGVTPAYVFGKLGSSIKNAMQNSAEERELRRAEDAAHAEEEREAAVAEMYRSRRASLNGDANAAPDPAPKATAKTKEAPAPAPVPAPAEETAPAMGKRYVRLDTLTGEMVEEADEPIHDPAAMAAATAAEQAPADSRKAEEPAQALPFREPAASVSAPADEGPAPESPVPDPAPAAPDPRSNRPDDEDDDEDEDGYGYVAARTPVGASPAAGFVDDSRAAAPAAADTMDVDYEDDPDSPDCVEDDPDSPDYVENDPAAGDGEDAAEDAAEPARSAVNYEVVTSAEAMPAADPSDKSTTKVVVLRSETAALPEAGLSEEELVTPTTFENEADEDTEEEEAVKEYVFPPVELLTRGPSRYEANDEEIATNTQLLRDVLESFHIRVKEINCSCGPTITRFEVKPESGIRVRSIANLVDDISMNLAKAGVRIEAPIPGKPAVGIEVPNAEPATVFFRNILETPEFRNHKSRLAACLGADVSGRPVIMDINKMPHLLVAGTTGSGKSVCINSIIMSILYKAKPDEVKLILIDPKKVEFAVFRDLPHLYCPLISDPNKAAGALNSAVNEMERRFGLIEQVGVRNIASYNEVTAGDPAHPPLPRMVIVIDELADLMMTASNDVETAICRLAQKGRAAGMHLILGTQRPSTDVITGLIKANVPSRIAFTVKQQIDSRIIIDAVGAEKLIGRGDMLYAPVGETKPLRVQGAFVSDGEVERVVSFIREHNERGEFDESFTREIEIETAKCLMNNKKKGEQVSIDDFDGLGGGNVSRDDAVLLEAMELIVTMDRVGTSAFQRHMNLGYGRAAKLVDRLEKMGFIGPDDGKKKGRPVYLTRNQLAEYKLNGMPGSGGSADSAIDSEEE